MLFVNIAQHPKLNISQQNTFIEFDKNRDDSTNYGDFLPIAQSNGIDDING